MALLENNNAGIGIMIIKNTAINSTTKSRREGGERKNRTLRGREGGVRVRKDDEIPPVC